MRGSSHNGERKHGLGSVPFPGYISADIFYFIWQTISAPEEKYLTLEGFHRFVIDRAKQDIRSVWRAILSCGYDLHFER